MTEVMLDVRCSKSSINRFLFAATVLAFIAMMAVLIVSITDDSDAGSTFTVDGISYETVSDTEVKVISNSYTGIVVIPSSVDYSDKTYSVISIDNYAFNQCINLTSVTIPDSVISIGEYAFFRCISLTSVSIPNSVTSIGKLAFCVCTSMTNITVWSGNMNYCSEGGVLFNKAKTTLIQYPAGKTYRSYQIPNTVTSIGGSAFYACTNLNLVLMSNGIKTIGNNAYEKCTSLTSVTLPNSVTSIGDDAFSGCTSIISVAMGNGIKTIGNNAYEKCTSLTSVTLPSSVTSIGDAAFSGCTSMISVTVPDTVTSIGADAFSLGVSEKNAVCHVHGCSDGALDPYKNAYTTFIYGGTEFIVAYDVNGGSGSVGYDLVSGEYTLKSYDGERANCDFIGWTDGSEVYLAESAVTISNDLMLYAVWERTDEQTFVSEDVGGNVLTYLIIMEPAGPLNGTVCMKSAPIDSSDTIIISVTVASSAKIYDVVSIGDYAFNGSTSLRSVSISGSVKYISDNAFNGCISLTWITVSSDNKNYCSEDKVLFNKAKTMLIRYPAGRTEGSYTIPDSVTSLGDNAFNGCKSLMTVSIPGGVTSLGDNAFNGCKSLMTVSIPGGVTSIGDNAFNGCKSLTGITVSSDNANYSSDGGVLFNKAKTMLIRYPAGRTEGSYTIPDSVTSISDAAFNGSIYLVSVTIVDSTISIGTDAFALGTTEKNVICHVHGCSDGFLDPYKNEYTTFIYGGTEFIVSYDVNGGSGSVEYEIGSGEYTLKSYGGNRELCNFIGWTDGLDIYPVGSTVIITADITFYAVWERVDKQMFTYADVGGTVLTYLIKREPAGALNGIVSLKSAPEDVIGTVTIPGIAVSSAKRYDVVSIDAWAFKNCTSLTSVTIPDSVTSIYADAFHNCTSLISVTIPDSVTSIGEMAFMGCTSLISVTIPDSVTYIGKGAFDNCTSLTSVTISNSITSINMMVFQHCKSLESVTIPDSVTSIYENAFDGCTSLISVTIPDSVTFIDMCAFSYCESLLSVIIGNGVTYIDESAFNDCTSLTDITVSSGNVKYSSKDGVLFNKAKTTLVMYPLGKTDKTYVIPDSVTSIGDRVFEENIKLTSVTIPDSVTSIGEMAFMGCTSLISVTIPDSVTFIGCYAFCACTSLNKIIFNAVNCSDFSSWDEVFYGAGVFGTGIDVIFGDKVTRVPANLFKMSDPDFVPNIISVIIPDTVTAIGIDAFYGCTFYDFDEKTEITDHSDLPGYFYYGGSSSELARHNIGNVIFNENGGSVTVSSMTLKDGEGFVLPEYIGTKTGHVFGGWSYGGEIYLPGQSAVKAKGDMSFVAVWTPLKYDAVFMNGDVVYFQKTYDYGSVIAVPEGTPEKASTAQYEYTFSRWNGFTEGMVITEDVVFDAVFSEKVRSYTVSFVSDGTTVKSDVLEYGAVIVRPVNDPVKASTAQYDFTFSHWSGFTEGMTVDKAYSFDAVFSEKVRSYTVSFVSDGTTVKSDVLEYGDEIVRPVNDPVKVSTAQYEYTFTGWNGFTEGMTVTGEHTFDAVFSEKVRSYTVSFVSEGKTVKTDEWAYGTVITKPSQDPVKESTAQYEYTFTGWNGFTEGMTVDKAYSFDAVFSEKVRSYTVSFVSEGKTVKTDELAYGTVITKPSQDPVKESTAQYEYTFTGWNGFTEGMTVDKAYSFDAVFSENVRTYTVSFISEGKTVKTDILAYGTVITKPSQDPVKESTAQYEYTFTGWNGFTEGMTVTGEHAFDAVFSEKVRTYTVSFVSEGKTVKTDELAYGTVISKPSQDPVKESTAQYEYTFTGWNGFTEGMTVDKAYSFDAVFSEKVRTYTVSFVSDGTTVKSDVLEYGVSIVRPANDPVKASTAQYEYTFTGWNGFTEGMTVDKAYSFDAVFSEKVRTYTVSFVSDGTTVKSDVLEYGAEIVRPANDPVKASTAQYEYTFTGWNGFTEGMTVTGEHTFDAVFNEKVRSYTVSFVSEGKTVKTDELAYGTVITKPSQDPVKESTAQYEYTFTGWNGFTEGMTVDKAYSFDAVFSEKVRSYAVSFVSEGKTVKTDILAYGTVITKPSQDPVKESTAQYEYTFTGWNGFTEGMTVDKAYSFDAVFSENVRTYTVSFVSDGITVKSDVLEYGAEIVRPANDPVKASTAQYEYTFTGWNGFTEGMTVDKAYSFDAVFSEKVRSYAVSFVSEGKTVKTDVLAYGTVISKPSQDPVKESTERYHYLFTGWNGFTEGMTVTGEHTFDAVFSEKVRTYTVSFVSEGKTVKTDELAYGTVISRPSQDPVKESTERYHYLFTGWNGFTEGMTVTDKHTFDAEFVEVLRTYDVKFVSEGSIYDERYLTYEETIVKPAQDPVKQSDKTCDYKFVRWNGFTEGMKVTDNVAFDAVFEATIKAIDTSGEKVIIDTKDVEDVKASSEIVDQIRDAGISGKGTEIALSKGRIALDSASAAGLPGGAKEISLNDADRSKIPVDIKEKIGDRPVYSISFGDVHDFNGVLTISVKYDLKDGEKADNVCIWYLKSDGSYERMSCTYSDGYATFNTTHLSEYAVMVEEPQPEPTPSDSGSNNIGLIVGAAVGVIAVIAIAAFIIVRRH